MVEPRGSGRWWGTDTDDEHRFQRAVSWFQMIRNAQAWRRRLDQLHMMAFGDLRYNGLWGTAEPALYIGAGGQSGWDFDALNEGVIRRIVLTWHAKVTATIPKPYFVVDGASREAKEAAIANDLAMQGLFYRGGWDDLADMACRHAGALGTGAVRILDGEKLPEYEIAQSWNLWVDHIDAMTGTPMTFGQIRSMDREAAAEKWPEQRDAVRDAPRLTASSLQDFDLIAQGDYQSDRILVLELWRLPTKTIHDTEELAEILDGPPRERRQIAGMHMACLANATLGVEEWWDAEPFVWFKRNPRLAGWWGTGITEELIAQQLELNRSLMARQDALRYCSSPYWLVANNVQVTEDFFTDIPGRVGRHAGQPGDVQLVTPSPVSPELFSHTESVRANMFADAGVSQLSASAQKPAGLNSGEALRRYAAIEDANLLPDIRTAWQRPYVQAALRTAQSLARIARRDGTDGTIEIAAPAGRVMKATTWTPMSGPWIVKVKEGSSLATTVAGRAQDIEDLQARGVKLSEAEVIDAMAVSDLEEIRQKHTVLERLCETLVEVNILKNGRAPQIEPEWPLDLLIQIGTRTLLECEANDARPSEERMDLLRKFVEEVRVERKKVAVLAAQMQPAAAAPMPLSGQAPAPASASNGMTAAGA